MLCIFSHSKKKKKYMHGNKASESLCIIKLDAGSNLQQIIEIMEGGKSISRATIESRPLVAQVWELRPGGSVPHP